MDKIYDNFWCNISTWSDLCDVRVYSECVPCNMGIQDNGVRIGFISHKLEGYTVGHHA